MATWCAVLPGRLPRCPVLSSSTAVGLLTGKHLLRVFCNHTTCHTGARSRPVISKGKRKQHRRSTTCLRTRQRCGCGNWLCGGAVPLVHVPLHCCSPRRCCVCGGLVRAGRAREEGREGERERARKEERDRERAREGEGGGRREKTELPRMQQRTAWLLRLRATAFPWRTLLSNINRS